MTSLSAIHVPDFLVYAVRWSRRVRLRIRYPGRVSYGRDFVVGPNFRLGKGRTLRVGNRVSIGPNFKCLSNLIGGDDVMISSDVVMVGNDHAFDMEALTITQQHRHDFATVRVIGDNLLGYGVLTCGNVTIGKGAIVGAGSLVTGVLPEYMVCVGRPAKPHRQRYS